MGIVAWIVLGLAAGLLANPDPRQEITGPHPHLPDRHHRGPAGRLGRHQDLPPPPRVCTAVKGTVS